MADAQVVDLEQEDDDELNDPNQDENTIVGKEITKDAHSKQSRLYHIPGTRSTRVVWLIYEVLLFLCQLLLLS